MNIRFQFHLINGKIWLGFGDFEIEDKGKGKGSRVIQYLKSLNCYDVLYCYVDADNEAAIRFYEKNGGVIRAYVDNQFIVILKGEGYVN